MQVPERFSNLPVYAFPRLRALLEGIAPGGEVINMSIGEPKHDVPRVVGEIIAAHTNDFGRYPPNEGMPELRAAFADWVTKRYDLAPVDPDTRVFPLNGTREGLFNALLALCPETKNGKKPVVLLPNPFYQVYMVAALTVGAEPVYVPATAETGFLPDFASLPKDVLDRTAICYMCSPSNPQGAVADMERWSELLDLAEAHDFRIFADECYSEIYRDAPPTGLLEAAEAKGADPERSIAFHSLSKRSSVPGLRSGFATSGPKTIAQLRQLRSYAGAPLPIPLQRAATALWQDEEHVIESRALYQQKFEIADRILGNLGGYRSPEAGFFLWIEVEDGEAATREIWEKTGVRILPGEYLSQGEGADNPGKKFIRVALVAPPKEIERGLTAIRDVLK